LLTLPPTVRVYMAAGPSDLRKSFDGLSGLATTVLGESALSGHLFVFCNRRRDRLKVLVWDGSGFWVCAKRLERGTFAWPDSTPDRTKVELTPAELTVLLGGLDVRETSRRRWWRRPEAPSSPSSLGATS
jgi:transposase